MRLCYLYSSSICSNLSPSTLVWSKVWSSRLCSSIFIPKRCWNRLNTQRDGQLGYLLDFPDDMLNLKNFKIDMAQATKKLEGPSIA